MVDYTDVLLSVLSEINDVLSNYTDHEILLGGDLNIDLRANSAHASSKGRELIHRFMNDFNLILCNDIIDTNSNYTYFHDTLRHYSYVDFFMVSHNISSSVISNSILDDGLCLSDHMPIVIEVKLKCTTAVTHNQSSQSYNSAMSMPLRWDRSNLEHYYAATYLNLAPVLEIFNDPLYSNLVVMNGSDLSSCDANVEFRSCTTNVDCEGN